jgi:hypothetical protein
LPRPPHAMRTRHPTHDFRPNSLDPSRAQSSTGRSRWNERAGAMCTTAAIAARSLRVARCRRGPATMNRWNERAPRRVPAWNASMTGRLHFQTMRLPQSRKRLEAHRLRGRPPSAGRMPLRNGIDREFGPNRRRQPVVPRALGRATRRSSDIFDEVPSPIAWPVRPLHFASGRKPGRAIAMRSSTIASQPSGWRRPVPSTTIAKRGWIRYGSTLRP